MPDTTSVVSAPSSQQPVLTLTSVSLNDSDRSTLRRVLLLMRSSRADLASKNAKTASAASSRLRVALYYLAGYLDGKGLISPDLQPGFANIFGAELGPRDPMETLDTLEKDLEALLDPTRVIGLGLGLIGIGIGLKVLGDWVSSLDD